MRYSYKMRLLILTLTFNNSSEMSFRDSSAVPTLYLVLLCTYSGIHFPRFLIMPRSFTTSYENESYRDEACFPSQKGDKTLSWELMSSITPHATVIISAISVFLSLWFKKLPTSASISMVMIAVAPTLLARATKTLTTLV